MFTRLFVPKWKHADPRVRCQAISSDSVPPEDVATAASEDSDPQVRRCAVERLNDPELLARLLDTETVTDVRDAALRRLRDLLAGPKDNHPPLDLRLKIMGHAASDDLCAFLARKAEAATIRMEVLEHISDTDMLIVIAVEDPVSSVRLAALERISDPQGWEIVAHNARKRDKQISRLARERLRAYHQVEEDRGTAERLCREMEDLPVNGPVAGRRGRFQHLVGQWAGLASDIPRQTSERFVQARELAAAEIGRLEKIVSERRAICVDLEDLLGRLRTEGEGGAVSSQELQQDLDDTVRRWRSLGMASVEGEPQEQRYLKLVHRVQQTLERREQDRLRAVPLESLLGEAREMLNEPVVPDERLIRQLQQRWAGLQQPESDHRGAPLQQEFDNILPRLRKRVKDQESQRRQALEKADGLLADMETALDQGELGRALSLRDRIRHLIKTARSPAETKRAAGLQRRLRSMQPRVDHLKDWRHWGSDRARERLCAEIEALAGSERTAADIAARVRNAREAWKRIDRAEGPAGEESWQRFDQACTRAYAPYQHERQEQAARLREHLQRKRELCDELEAFMRDTDWNHVDWQEADQRVHRARKRWRRIGPVSRKARKAIEQAYREVLERLESHLEVKRESELRRRRALITRVEELVDFKDPRAASREVRQIQAGWRPVVQAAPSVEQALWKQFRAACDAVFGRISQEQEAATAELENHLAQKKALCDKLESLLGNPDLDAAALTAAFAEAGREWGRIGIVPRKDERAMEARFEAINKRFGERRRQQERLAAEAELHVVEQRSRLCENLEHEALEMVLTEEARQSLLESTQVAWQALGPLTLPQEALLLERFELAARVLGGDDSARKALFDTLTANLKQRRQLCLQLEIAAEIESPPEYADAKMQLQVSRLSDALHHRQASSRTAKEALRDLLIAWYQTGPVPGDAQGELEARFERVMAALKVNHRD